MQAAIAATIAQKHDLFAKPQLCFANSLDSLAETQAFSIIFV
jgi:hypothetical protein